MTQQVRITTYKDLLDHATDYVGVDASKEAFRTARRAVQAAYRDFGTMHRWSYYYFRGRLATVAQQNTGTIAYTHTGGTYERMVTLTGATWPAWAPFGTLRVGTVSYEVDSLKSGTVLTLTSMSNPGADIAAGTSYTFYRDSYPLPVDFLAADEMINVGQVIGMTYVHPKEWLSVQRLVQGPATPRHYTIAGDPNYFGTMAVRFFPAPDQVYQIDFLYQRRPRQLVIDEYKAGALSVTNGSAAVTGSGTAWTSDMVGSVLRIGSDATNAPTSLTGQVPYDAERTVVAVGGATSITTDAVFGDTLSGVKYTLSDPVDVEEGAMLTGLLRDVERQMRLMRRMKATPEEAIEHQRAMTMAMEADSRNFARRAAGEDNRYRPRLAYMPRGADVS